MAFPDVEPCGARTRSGVLCRQPGMRSNGRCKLHGGRTPRGLKSASLRPGDPAVADREPEHLPTHLEQPLIPDLMPLVEVAKQRLDPRPQRPCRLQPRRIGALGPVPAPATPCRVLPRFDHHRPYRRQLHHLTPTHPALTDQRQRFAAALAGARPTPHDHVRRLPPTADAIVPAPSLPRPTLGPVRFEPDRRRHRRVARRLRRPAQAGQLGLQLGDPQGLAPMGLDGSGRPPPPQASLTRTDHRGAVCGETRTHGVRREALRCIPDAVGRNLEECSWVAWFTWTRKREGTRACQESGGRLEASRAACRETHAIWPRLDCLKPNLQW